MLTLPILYAVLGLLVGSFLNVCIYRLPRGESVVFPGSHCPRCGKALRPWDNIPLISYLLLRGKCRYCGNPISFQYPLVELLTGMAFYSCALEWEFDSPTFVNTLFLCLTIILVFIDYHHQILPNRITLPGTAVAILISPLQGETFYRDILTGRLIQLAGLSVQGVAPWPAAFIGSIVGAILGGGVLFLVAYLYQLARKRQGLGMGDVKMVAMVGAFIGWPLALLTVFMGSLLGSIIGIFLIAFKGRNLQHKLAFGVFLGAGAGLALFFGTSFVSWYLGNL